MIQYFAHSLDGQPPEKWQPLEKHLQNVAEMAAGFAEPFGSAEWARLAGLWHDLGKYSQEFQRYIKASADTVLETVPGLVNHSTAGGQLAIKRFDKRGRLVAYSITGHHAGLPDWQNEYSPLSSMRQRLECSDQLMALEGCSIPSFILEAPFPTEKPRPGTDLARSFWLRMLFFCLVDADFLDTESFMGPTRYSASSITGTKLSAMRRAEENEPR